MTLVTVNYNDWEMTASFVQRVEKFSVIHHIIIVDNCSTDDSYEQLKSLTDQKIKVILSEKNGGYGYGNNLGIGYAKNNYNEKFILICNPDVIFDEDIVSDLRCTLEENDSVGAAGVVMKNMRNEVQRNTAWKISGGWMYVLPSIRIIKRFIDDNLYKVDFERADSINVDCIAGSMLMVSVDAFLLCGGYDENIFLYCEETALGMRLKRIGKSTKLLTGRFFIHNHSHSITKEIASKRNREKMVWKSKKYVLRTYFGFNKVQIMLVTLMEYFNYILDDIQGK